MIDIQDLRVVYRGVWPQRGIAVRALDQVSLQIGQGEALGVVGESGSGKSTLGRVLLRLVKPDCGIVHVNGDELFSLRRPQLRKYRRRVQVVFQDTVSSLNPRLRIGDSIREGLDIHRIGSFGQRRQRVIELLRMVGLEEDYARRYPHTLSGGQRQRVNIARALALEPRILIADEPVSALDVSIQAQILELMSRLQMQKGLTMVFISHDLRVVRSLCDRVVVLHKGRIVEQGKTKAVFKHPQHEYTKLLISSAPVIRQSHGRLLKAIGHR
jgi:peptide/nickel transport system ATP-binding protein